MNKNIKTIFQQPSNQEEEPISLLVQVEEIFSRLSGKVVPKEESSLLQTSLELLERVNRHPRLSRKIKAGFIECAIRAFEYVRTIFTTHNALLASILEGARNHAVSLGDKRSTAIFDLQLATILLLLNRVSESREACTRGLAVIDALGDKSFADYAHRFLIVYYTLRGEPRKALDAYEQIRTSLHAEADPYVLKQVIPLSALNAVYVGKFRLGKSLLINGWRTAQIHGYTTIERCLEAHLGWLLVAAGDLKQARPHIEAGINIPEEQHVPISRFWAERSKAFFLYAEADLNGSYEQMNLAITHAERDGLKRGFYTGAWMLEMFQAFHWAGFPSIPGFDYEKEIRRIDNDQSLLLKGVAFRLLALDARRNDSPAAEQLDLLRKSETLLANAGALMELAKTWLETARVHLQKGDLSLAKPLITKAWQVYEHSASNLFPEDLHYLLEPTLDLPKEESPWPGHDLLMDTLEQMLVPPVQYELYHQIVNVACSFFGAARGGLFVQDRDAGSIRLESALNFPGFDGKKTLDSRVMDSVGRSFKQEVPLIQDRTGDNAGPTIVICIPLTALRPRRVLYLETYSLDTFQEYSRQQVLQLSSHIGRQLSLFINMIEKSDDAHRHNLGQMTKSKSTQGSKILFQSAAMDQVLHLANLAAQTDVPILILGETGVGKELLAHHIHEQSQRWNMPFIAVDLSSLPVTLLESEMFGHEKGAFTGANAQRAGYVTLADRGTLFIDEIGEVPLSIQPKLLRMIQEKTYRRVGGTKLLRSDFRLITATNRDLLQDVRKGLFREDLYHRLNVVSIVIPPLRERQDDIVYLAEHFLAFFARKYAKAAPVLSKQQKHSLEAYSWPGNIRELRNLMERVVVLQEELLLHLAPQVQFPHSFEGNNIPLNFSTLPTLDELQITYIRHVLRQTDGRMSGKKGAVGILGLNRSTLYHRMKKLGITGKE